MCSRPTLRLPPDWCRVSELRKGASISIALPSPTNASSKSTTTTTTEHANLTRTRDFKRQRWALHQNSQRIRRRGMAVVAPVAGAFAEMLSHGYAIADMIAFLLAARALLLLPPCLSKGVCQQRLFCSWGLGAYLGWARSSSGRTTEALTNIGAPFLTESPVRGTR